MVAGLALLVVAASARGEVEARIDAAPPRLGVQLDVGLPDGLGASLAYMPAASLRLHLGGVNNGLGSGFRGGAVLLAFPSLAWRPLLGVEGGSIVGGPGAWLPEFVPDPIVRAVLSGASVTFVNTQLGFELGSRHVALVVRAGMSWVRVTPRDQEFPLGDAGVLRLGGLSLSGFIPSARIGLLVCFG
jgi:hypothetical protein